MARKGNLDIGVKLLKLSVSRFALFSNGCTTADLKTEGTTPEDKDLLKTVKISEDKKADTSLKNLVGKTSKGEEEDFMLLIRAMGVSSNKLREVFRSYFLDNSV